MSAQPLLSVLSSNITALRTARGLSQAELAERADISIGHLNDLERSRKWIGAGTLERLADALGVEPYRLLIPPRESKQFENLNTIGAVERELRERIRETVSDVLIKYYPAEMQGEEKGPGK